MSLPLFRGPCFNKRLSCVIARVIAKLEHFDDQKRKRKGNVEQKGQLKEQKGKRKDVIKKGNEARRHDKSNMK